MNGINLIYETLLSYDPRTGQLVPQLAESYRVDEDSIEVVLQERAHFSDGQPVTGYDVKFTFDLGRKYKSVQVASAWSYLSDVQLPEHGQLPPGKAPRRVVFRLAEPRNPLVILDYLQNQRILPRHVIEPLLAQSNNDINEFNKLKFDKNPIGSGPYKLYSYSNEKIATIRDDNYWGNDALYGGKKAGPKYVVHPIYKSNEHFSVALQQGRVDISSSFVPRIWLKQKKGVHAWYDQAPYFTQSVIPMLLINVEHRPLDDPQMRRAIAFSINYADVRELAASGYSDPLQSGLILPSGLEAKYFSAEDAKQYGASVYDPERAKATLKAAGYQPIWNEKGELLETRDAQGRKLPTLYVKCPAGWTDWQSMVRIVVRSMRAVGIDARERFVDASLFWTAQNNGDFDFLMNTPSAEPSPSKPWSRFEFVMNSADYRPEGEKMFKNYGRFNNPKSKSYEPRIDELLKLIPQLKDEAELVKAYRELNVLFMKLQPTFLLVYRSEAYYEYSDRVWTGFPNAASPFLPGQQPGERMGTRILWHLTPAH